MKSIIQLLIAVPFVYGGMIVYAMVFPSNQAAEYAQQQYTAKCKADWETLQTQSLKKYGIANFATPDYCYDKVKVN